MRSETATKEAFSIRRGWAKVGAATVMASIAKRKRQESCRDLDLMACTACSLGGFRGRRSKSSPALIIRMDRRFGLPVWLVWLFG